MNVRKTLGGALFGMGCAVAFVGLLATALPMIPNDQLRLVLSSFEMPSENWFVNAVNGAMTYALQNCYGVLLAGLVLMLAGVPLMLVRDARGRGRSRPSPYSRPQAAREQPAARPQEPIWQRTPQASPDPFDDPFDDAAVQALLTPRMPDAAAAIPVTYAPPPILPPSNAEEAPPAPFAPEAPEAPAPEPPVAEAPAPPASEPSMPACPGPASQSGSRVVIRSTVASRPRPDEAPPAQRPSGKVVLDGVAYEPNEPPKEENAAQQPSSRIRSTMGRHTV